MSDSNDIDVGCCGSQKAKLLPQDDPTGENQYPCYVFGWQFWRWYYRHPYFRCVICIGIAFLNFLIYAEDPIAHSQVEAFIPVIGTDLDFLFGEYHGLAPGLQFLKVVCVVFTIFFGMYVGRQWIHHRILRDRFKIKMFDHNKGTWMVMFWTVIFVGALGATIYNVFLGLAGDQYKRFRVDQKFGMTNEDFMKIAASGTWMGDFLTAYMVIDMMLQDDEYPQWARCLRPLYQKPVIRITLFWFITTGLCSIVIGFIATDFINWDQYGDRLDYSSTELGRAFLASFITMMDLMIVMQDWEFPIFVTNQDINLPGLNTHEIKFKFRCPLWCEQLGQFFKVHITGKWFNYGIIFCVMGLDMNMLKNQMTYTPDQYGQYVDPDGHIWTIRDKAVLLDPSLDLLSPTIYQDRIGKGDLRMNAKFLNYSNSTLGIALMPVIFAGLLFFVLFRMEHSQNSSHDTGKRHDNDYDSDDERLRDNGDAENPSTELVVSGSSAVAPLKT